MRLALAPGVLVPCGVDFLDRHGLARGGVAEDLDGRAQRDGGAAEVMLFLGPEPVEPVVRLKIGLARREVLTHLLRVTVDLGKRHRELLSSWG
ncbi:MAG: hypothetical protein E6J45_14735 [Chloroflexi bacterium]|nr:MAG: hypothetical protein E6J45_14735 [Chloroflexota bacterium]